MESDKRFKKLVEESKNITLFQKEKELIRSNLISLIKRDFKVQEGSVKIPYYQKLQWLYAGSLSVAKSVINNSVLRYSLSMILIFLFLGSSIVFGAKDSLPGDFLYHVKTQINEKVLEMVTFSGKGKAEYSIELAQARLEEMEKLAVGNKLNDQLSKDIKDLFNKHMSNAKIQMSKIDNKDSAIFSQINTNLEASLNAHSSVLKKISNEVYEGESQKNNIKEILSDVDNNIAHTESERYKQQSKLFSQGEDALAAESKRSFFEAEKEIEKTIDFIESKKIQVSVNTYIESKDNLQLAENALSESKSELDTQSYETSFALSQLAGRMAKEIRISMEAEANLKIKLNMPTIKNKGKDEK